jgi:hypothetical protein
MFRAAILAAALGSHGSTMGPAPHRVSSGFSSVVVHHVNRVMGTEHLPAGQGQVVQPGIFVVLSLESMQIFDRDVAALERGRVVDRTTARECRSQCPAAFFDSFKAHWLQAAVESSSFGVGLPSRVSFAAHADLPTQTLFEAAYAAAETRPIQPPTMSLLVNSPARGLQAIDFHLLPPEGLEVRRGAGAALGMTIAFGQGGYEVSANDRDFMVPRQAQNLAAVRSITRTIKRRYPGKQTVVLVPDETVSVRDLVDLTVALREDFPRVVFSQGQDLVLP